LQSGFVRIGGEVYDRNIVEIADLTRSHHTVDPSLKHYVHQHKIGMGLLGYFDRLFAG